MASIMERDPWTWTIADVTAFFVDRHAQQAMADMPGTALPPLEQFTEKFKDEGVTGAVLLSALDDEFLRRRCKIATLGPRAAVMHCIKKLRAISLGYKTQDQPTIWSTTAQQETSTRPSDEELRKLVELLVPGGRLAQLFASHLAPVISAAQVQAVGDPMQVVDEQPASLPTPVTSDQSRPNESIIEAKDGKKQRRLDISAVQRAPKISQAFRSEDAELSLPQRKLPIDEIFFDGTALGRECGAMKIDHPLYIHEGSDIKELDEKNFQYINPYLHDGVAEYVGSKLQRSMYAREDADLVRHERYAVSVHPYASGLNFEPTQQSIQYGRRGRIIFGGTRSAMLVKSRAAAGSKNRSEDSLGPLCVATRENETVLASEADKYGPEADLSGEHEHLLLKYREDEDDLMSESDKEGSKQGFDESDDNTSSEFGDDQAEEVDEERAVGQTDVKDIIDRVFDNYITKWKENVLPGLEATKAWTVWKQTKRSKTIRDQLIESARTTIAHLQFRLSKARKEFEGQVWEDEVSVERLCKNFEATVEDIQHQRWKIEVWGRTQEPAHTTAHKTNNKRTISAPQYAQHHDVLPLLGSQDRLSVSPRPPSPLAEPTDLNDRNSDMEREQFHTPHDSPVLEREDSHFVVPDDDVMQIDEHDQATAGALEDDDVVEATNEVQPHVNRTRSGHVKSPSTPSKASKAGILKTPTTATRFKDPTTADMPSPSVLAERKSVKTSPAVSVIDITGTRSRSIEPTTPALMRATSKKVERRRKRGRPTIQDYDDEKPSTSEADGWKYSDLVQQEDRGKLLQKLLRDIGQMKRDALANTFTRLKFNTFPVRLLSALDTFVSPRDESSAEEDVKETPRRADDPDSPMVKLAARLLLAHYFCRPDVHGEGEPIPADILAQTMPKRTDADRFCHILRGFLMQRAQPLYSSPKPVSFDNEVITINSTDDEAHDQGDMDMDSTPRSTRKRKKTQSDFDAERKRQVARERHKVFGESQQQRSSDSSMLQGMVLENSSPGDKVINLVRKPNQEPIFIEAKIATKMKSYQLEGVQFLWRELTSDPDQAQGCLLAHTMGLGKTMQSIALLRCVDTASQSPSENITSQLPQDLQLGAERNKRSLRFLIICPSSLMPNWHRELREWVHPRAFGGNIFTIESTTANTGFMKTLKDWAKYGGVLLIGYPIFQKIVNRQPEEVAEEEHFNARKLAEVTLSNENIELARKIITEDAELVVADEAHHVKNPKTSTARAANEIKTNARIALTGTPMSNDVDEIYALITWVSPGFLGDKAHFSDYFGVPIKNGLYVDSTSWDKRKSTIKLKSLHHEIEPKVHRAGISVLKGELKPKVEFVITVELTKQQREAYAATVAALLGAKDLNLTALTSIFAWLGVLGLLTAHPRSFRRKLLTPVPPSKDQGKRAGKAGVSRKSTSATTLQDSGARTPLSEAEVAKYNESSPEVPGDESVYALGFTEAIVKELVEGLTDNIDPALSAKTRLTRKILQLSKKCGDKVLIFSASIPSLNYLSDLLTRDNTSFGRIDGSMKMEVRTKLLDRFKSGKGDLDVLLISTRAGGQGLNIQTANRVIIFDFGFNPAWEEQAIGRAYRFGQLKPVFVYRFVAGGTFESNIYNTQMFKTSLASRVVDKKNPHRNAIRNTKEYLYPPKDVKHEDLSNELEINLDPSVLSKIMQAQIERGDARDPSIDICTVRTMEVLQAEDQEAPLDPEELKQVEEFRAAWKDSRLSGYRPTTTDLSLSRSMGAPSSTAPVTAGPSGIRTVSMPSSTQAPAHSVATMPRTLTQVANMTTAFPARDIRNGSGMNLPPDANTTMGGLPFSGFQ
jgi:SNF2 family DNA or RNA helicase